MSAGNTIINENWLKGYLFCSVCPQSGELPEDQHWLLVVVEIMATFCQNSPKNQPTLKIPPHL